ncbi:MAG TPA: TIGR03435 family protein [Bryobacteraceae bacterium]|nr:TIGR03435 family protein [Bryobacteraceae bacterium]
MRQCPECGIFPPSQPGLTLAGILIVLSAAALAQPLPAAASQPAFEVASIKSSTDRQHGNVTEIAPGGERFTATNASLKLLLMTAYGVNDRQISGGPSWLNSEFYDIQAKAERPSSPEQVHLMLQTLLQERFKLRLHKTTEQQAMYVLTAEDYQSKIHENRSGVKPHIGRGSSGQTVFENVPMSQLTYFLQLRLRREVLDRTGLKGNFDFELAWTPDLPSHGDGPESTTPADPEGPSIATALREQLGLKFTATKGPVEVLAIDAAEKPGAN